MLTLRKANDRGHENHGWLQTYHSFSFASYYDPNHMGFSVLRVINDDTVAANAGFGTHGHRDMEIVSYVLSGALQHKDNMGNGSVIRPGDVQRMSAGTGVTHSEYNASDHEPVNFLQIWILPNVKGIEPSYEQKSFLKELDNELHLVVSPDGRSGSIMIHQNVWIYAGKFTSKFTHKYQLSHSRQAYLHLAKGCVKINGETLHSGDALAIRDESEINMQIDPNSELLLFDLP